MSYKKFYLPRIWSSTDRKSLIPRIWSNKELDKFANLFQGSVINVSGWMDNDKEGRCYRDYFSQANEYWISNYINEAKGFQGNLENEFFLDLAIPLDGKFHGKYDVVFNHTVLEHVFEFETAFNNLCKLSADIVIIVVPFLQEEHGSFGDYWRFTPQAIDKLFKKNNLDNIYINYNDQKNTSIYIFAIGSKMKNKWKIIQNNPDNKLNEIYEVDIGKKIIRGNPFEYIKITLRKALSSKK